MIAVHPNIISIRDLQSVADMAKRLSSARKIVVVGNGGIALELVHSVRSRTVLILSLAELLRDPENTLRFTPTIA